LLATAEQNQGILCLILATNEQDLNSSYMPACQQAASSNLPSLVRALQRNLAQPKESKLIAIPRDAKQMMHSSPTPV